MKKRVMSLLLAVCLLLSLCPAGVEIAVGGAGAAAGITFTVVPAQTDDGYADYEPERLLDGNTATEWMQSWVGLSTVDLTFAASERVVLTGYTLVASQNSDLFQARQPYRWELLGRNAPDGDWTLLDTVTNTSNRVYANGESLHYDMADNTAYYRYYRIRFYRDPVSGTTGGSPGVVAFAEWQPQYTACAHNWHTTSTVDATCTAPDYTYQYCAVCKEERTLSGAASNPTGHDLDADGVCRRCHRQNPVTVGPFVISGKNLVEGVDYQLGGISDPAAAILNPTGLYILSDKDITIENADKTQEICEYQIVLLNNGAVNVTLGGVNLNLKNSNVWGTSTSPALFVVTKYDRADIMAMLNGDGDLENGWNVDWDAVEAEDWSNRVVTLTLEAGSNNFLTGAVYGAGVGKSEAKPLSGQLVITGTGCLTATAEDAAGIGSATIVGDTGDITITGGCTVVACSAGGGAIGGGSSGGNATNITIENSTVTAIDNLGGYGIVSGFRLVDGSIKGNVMGVTPTDADGQPVYLAVIPNPNGEAVIINGRNYTIVDHTAADPTDTNLYAYLSDPTEVKHIQVGDKQFHYHFDSAQKVFRSYQDAYQYSNDLHWQVCRYAGCTETVQRTAHDHSTFAKDTTQYWKACVCGHEIAHKSLPAVTVNFPTTVCDKSAIPFTVTTTDGAAVLAEESTFTGDNATFLAMLPTAERMGGTQSLGLCMTWGTTLENPVLHLMIQTTDGFAYMVDWPVTVADVFLSHVDTDDDHLCDVCEVEVSVHTGGTATCKAAAECTECGESYGDVDAANHADSEATWVKTATTHEKVWKCCAAVAVAEAAHDWNNGTCKDCEYVCAHTGGTATCKAAAECTECGESYGDVDAANHADSEATWVKTATTHEKVWKCCAAVAVAEAAHDWNNGTCKDCEYVCTHTGGTATCKAQAECTECGESYGDVDAANHAALTHVAAVAATTESEGRREHWHCADCARDFLDAAGTVEATATDLVTAKLPVPLTTGEGVYTVLWTMLALSGGTLLVTVLCGARRRRRTTGKH